MSTAPLLSLDQARQMAQTALGELFDPALDANTLFYLLDRLKGRGAGKAAFEISSGRAKALQGLAPHLSLRADFVAPGEDVAPSGLLVPQASLFEIGQAPIEGALIHEETAGRVRLRSKVRRRWIRARGGMS